MSKTNLPGFTADVSLYKTRGRYFQTCGEVINSATQLISAIFPAMINTGGVNCSNCVGGECVELRCFENWTHGGGGPRGPYEGGGGGGGFGGGGGTLRSCVDFNGQRRRHGSIRTTTEVLPPGGPENTFVTQERCRNGRWNVV